MISVLLPAHNESSNLFFWKTLDTIKALQKSGFPIEVLIGATQGSDDTFQQLEQRQLKFFSLECSNRAGRFNKVLAHASCGPSDWIILNHPRSVLEFKAFLALDLLSTQCNWGAFTHQFDVGHPLLSFTSWWSNHVRGDIKNIFYLDHCFFIRRKVLESIGGVPEMDIFEDTVLSQRLSRLHPPVRLPWKSTTSTIRFTTNGIYRQALINQMLKIQFMMGKDHGKMNKSYEKGMNLNCRKGEGQCD